MIYFADINIGDTECHGLVRVHCDEDADFDTFTAAKAERWSVRSGWFERPHFQLDFVYGGGDVTSDYAPIPADRVEEAQKSMREQAARPAPPPWTVWTPAIQLSLWFMAVLDGLESGVITADEIPMEAGFNHEVIDALKVIAAWDLEDQWIWRNTPVNKRGASPLWLAHLALAKQCRAVERRKTHCPKGHEYTDENTRLEVRRGGKVARHCRECDRQRNRLRYAARKTREVVGS